MHHDPHPIQPRPSEWSRCGRFFLLAIALHGALLIYPLKLAMDAPEAPPKTVLVRLKEAISPVPAAQPKTRAQPSQPSPVAQRTLPAPVPRPILALAPEQSVAPSSFSVPAPAPLPSASAASPVALAIAAGPAPSTTPARFDAAYLDNPKPQFPAISRRLGEEGKVQLRVRVSREGVPLAVDLEKSSNFERLDEAARQTVARWKFVPARRGDETIEATVIVPIVFRLDN